MKIERLTPSCNLSTIRDGRGGIFTFIPKDPIVEFNHLFIKSGKVRGHHYHPEFDEYFLLVSGEAVVVTKDSSSSKEEFIFLSKGQGICTPKGTPHAVYAISDCEAVAMLTKKWDESIPPIIHEDLSNAGNSLGEAPDSNKPLDRKEIKIGLFGAKGFVGSEISKSLKNKGYEVQEITRDNFEENLKKEFDYVINAATPSSRFKAKNNPEWDFRETVEKTSKIFREGKYNKFVQISSISARSQTDTVYGKNKFAAEAIVNNGESLIVRLFPMYSPTLKKGVLIDMLNGQKVFVDENSRYAFTPLEFVAEWISNNLERKGIIEVGAKNSISLSELANKLNLNVEFEGAVDHQEVQNPDENYPNVDLVLDFMKEKLGKGGIKRIESCRVCGNRNLKSCIDIGEQYLSSVFPENLNYKNELKKYPLEILQCIKTDDSQCGSLQLAYDYDLSEMYDHYPYTSASNSSMKKILEDVANSGKALNNLKSGDTILDIGGNDGTLLSFFKDKDLNLVIIDPAKNIESHVNSNKFVRLKEFFTAENFRKVSNNKAKLVFGIAMFYHLSDPVGFCKNIGEILDDNGAVIIQMAYLPSMIDTDMYDNIVHEHVGYYGVQHMKWIFEKAGLELFDVKLNDVYGGSFRVFAKKKGNPNFPQTQRLQIILEGEKNWGIFEESTYYDFMKRINYKKEELKNLLEKIKREGKKTWIYGASTKGNTIMQFCGIDNNLIEAAADSNSFKFNKYIIGSDIPIVDEQKLRLEKPDYLLALPYSFVNSFREREKELVEKGTKFIVPLPEVKII